MTPFNLLVVCIRRRAERRAVLQVTVVSLELASPTLPPGKELVMNLLEPAALASMKKNPVTIKEGIEFKWGIPTFASGS